MANCDKCSGRGYHNLKLKKDDARFPEVYTPGVTAILRIQPCKACDGTGQTDKRRVDPSFLRMLFG